MQLRPRLPSDAAAAPLFASISCGGRVLCSVIWFEALITTVAVLPQKIT